MNFARGSHLFGTMSIKLLLIEPKLMPVGFVKKGNIRLCERMLGMYFKITTYT